jgi:hypothetical protein
MPTTAAVDIPFHLRGHISPQRPAAWKAMKWHDAVLNAVLDDLDRDPPEYILVRAPALSGKTTFAVQFRERVLARRPDIFTVYIPVGAMTISPEVFLYQLRQAFLDHVGELLDSMTVQDLSMELSDALVAWGTLEFEDLHGLLRGLIRHLPSRYRRVVVVIDDCDRVPARVRMDLAEALRTIHADRATGPLRGFSILLLGRSLLRGPEAVSPLCNVVQTHRLRDFSPQDVAEFIQRCSNAAGGMRVSSDTVDYFYRKTRGHAVVLQRLLKTAAGRQDLTSIDLVDAYRAVCDCYEQGGGIVDRLLDLSPLSDGALTYLDSIMRGAALPCLEFEPGIAELVDLGLVAPGPTGLCICRSPLVHELLVRRYFAEPALPDLTTAERYLVGVPPVLAMVASDTLFHRVKDRLRAAVSTGFAQGVAPINAAVGALKDSGHSIDLSEIQYYYDRFYGELSPLRLETGDVLRVVAKVHLAWSKEDD